MATVGGDLVRNIKEGARKTIGLRTNFKFNDPLWDQIILSSDELIEEGKRSSVIGIIESLQSQSAAVPEINLRATFQKKPSVSERPSLRVTPIKLEVFEYKYERPPIIFNVPTQVLIPVISQDQDVKSILQAYGFRSDRLSSVKSSTKKNSGLNQDSAYSVNDLKDLARQLKIKIVAGDKKEDIVNKIKQLLIDVGHLSKDE